MNRVHLEPREIIPCAVPTRKTFINVLGQTFGRLTVTKFLGRYANHNGIIWECQCACGTVCRVPTSSLTVGGQKSCGCWRKESFIKRFTTHGMTGSTEYNAWLSMWARCTNPKLSEWHRYGGRGITVCERWKDFASFLEDMGLKPSPKHSLDRWPNRDGNYEPSNCRWATQQQQMRNYKFNNRIAFNGETLCVCEWAERTGIKASTILRRLDRGWTVEQALTTPLIPPQGPYVGFGHRPF